MLTPYAITRTAADSARFTDHVGRDIRPVNAFGLSLFVGDPIDPSIDAEGFMQSVVAIHDTETCVPVRLDEPLPDETAARRFLETGADRFSRLLDRLAGSDEWSIIVEPPRESGSAAGAAGPTPVGEGRSYLEQRRRDMDTAAGIHPDVSSQIALLSTALTPRARDVRTIATRIGGGSLALLVDRDTNIAASFREAAENVTLPCALTGPWPPFSFVSLTT